MFQGDDPQLPSPKLVAKALKIGGASNCQKERIVFQPYVFSEAYVSYRGCMFGHHFLPSTVRVLREIFEDEGGGASQSGIGLGPMDDE